MDCSDAVNIHRKARYAIRSCRIVVYKLHEQPRFALGMENCIGVAEGPLPLVQILLT